MKVALVHEYLTQLGGAERVLQNFLEIWPDAVIHTLIYDKTRTHGVFEPYAKKINYLNSLPWSHKHTRLLLPLMPKAIESFRFQDFDVVISDSSSFAKGIKTDKLHICYCHTSTRYLWTNDEYLENQRYPGIFKILGKWYLPMLKKWDYKASQRPNFFIANSRNVQSQIKRFYDRDSVVIPPPVDTQVFHPEGEKQNYFFTASRLEPYKKIDLVIKTFNKLKLPLKIAGIGTMFNELKNMAGRNIEFLGRLSDDELRKRYSQAQAFIFPAEEDAGIMVLEAQACGTPVIAYRKGGSLETILDGVTGEFFNEQSEESLNLVITHFDPSKYNRETLRAHALEYDKIIFREKIKEFVEKKYITVKNTISSEARNLSERDPSASVGMGDNL